MSMQSSNDRLEAIGIIGAGRLGQALARSARRAGRRVILANSRGPASLTEVVDALGAGVIAGTVADATSCAIVGLSVPWDAVRDALAGPEWAGQIVIDTTNAVSFPSLQPIPLGERTSSEIVAELVTGAWVVKAANTLGANVLGADPTEHGGNRVLFMSGDHRPAKDAVAELFDGAGFSTIDVGDLATGGRLHQAGGPLAQLDLVRFPPPG